MIDEIVAICPRCLHGFDKQTANHETVQYIHACDCTGAVRWLKNPISRLVWWKLTRKQKEELSPNAARI
jgi:hypothetical protein